ncbi:hypothetical protein [Roseovarius mucosus]|uniref:hypothetical protein n=1 Tax=Roseovarius mucosus TaxID=215743 RepID=UPI0035CFB240
MKITNTTKSDLGLSPDVVVPAGGSMEIEEGTLEQLSKSPVVQAWAKDGWLVAEEPAAEGAEIETARFELVAGVVRGLGPDGFIKSGKPDVDAINAVLPTTTDRITAKERDAIWAQMQDA